MIVNIIHRTNYNYTDPVLRSVQYIRLTPRSGPGQTVNRWQVECQGADLTEWNDQFGNICHTMVVKKPTEAITVEVKGQVRTIETHGVLPTGMTSLPQRTFLRETRYTALDPALRKFANGFKRAIAKDPVAGLHAMMMELNAAIAYEEGETSVHTTAGEAFADGRGVCQDHAHAMIATCRHLGLPARYVSGYLANGESNSAEVHAASHAWCETLVPALGWVSFDAANGVSASELYVRGAVGFDYGDAAPIRGMRVGGGEETMDVVIELSGQQ